MKTHRHVLIDANPRDHRHGKVGGYTNNRCRCERCRDAWRVYCQKRRFEREAELLSDPTLTVHGSALTYANWRCRCRPCTDAWAVYCRERTA